VVDIDIPDRAPKIVRAEHVDPIKVVAQISPSRLHGRLRTRA
jgi:hypothetical protein